jgi:hypothetical protein
LEGEIEGGVIFRGGELCVEKEERMLEGERRRGPMKGYRPKGSIDDGTL